MSLGVHCWQWQILYRYLRMSTLWQAPTHANTSLSTYAVGQSPYHISFGLSGFSLLMSLPACPACGKVFNKFASFLVHFFSRFGLVWFAGERNPPKTFISIFPSCRTGSATWERKIAAARVLYKFVSVSSAATGEERWQLSVELALEPEPKNIDSYRTSHANQVGRSAAVRYVYGGFFA